MLMRNLTRYVSNVVFRELNDNFTFVLLRTSS